MTPEQAAAFVIAQAACAMAEIAAMQAEDRLAAIQGHNGSIGNEYRAIADTYCISHNAVMQLFQDVNGGTMMGIPIEAVTGPEIGALAIVVFLMIAGALELLARIRR